MLSSIYIHLVGVIDLAHWTIYRFCSKLVLSASSRSELLLNANPHFHGLTSVLPCNTNRLLHYHRYLRWAEAIGDSRGVSHANMCLARVYDILGNADTASRHKKTSLEGCRRVGDIENHGKVRAHPTLLSSFVVTYHLKNTVVRYVVQK